jgi:hypothetical protein
VPVVPSFDATPLPRIPTTPGRKPRHCSLSRWCHGAYLVPKMVPIFALVACWDIAPDFATSADRGRFVAQNPIVAGQMAMAEHD